MFRRRAAKYASHETETIIFNLIFNNNEDETTAVNIFPIPCSQQLCSNDNVYRDEHNFR